MLEFAIVVSALLFFLAVLMTAWIAAFIRSMKPAAPTEVDDASLPKFAVLMPLRGADPFLKSAIHSVLDQDYPEFELHVIVDHPDDPAWEAVRAVLDDRPADNVRVSVLEDKPPTCGLICSAVRQFIRDLDEKTELVIVCAADMVVPPNWLKEAAVILKDPTVGATLGNRWFMPRKARFASIVRYIWNCGASVSLYHHQGVWSGGMALRAADVRRLNLPEVWGRSMVEDMTVAEPILKAGLKLKHTPTIVVVNREEATMAGNFNFIKRQHLFTYLYHPRGFRMIAEFAPMSLVVLVALGTLITSLILGHREVVPWIGGALLFASASMLTMIGWVESRIRRIMHARGEETTPIKLTTFLKMPSALLVTQVLYLITIPLSIFTRRVRWRGITYRLKSAYDIQMESYQPFVQREETEAERISV